MVRSCRPRLQHIRQVAGVQYIVSSLHDVPVGDVWTDGDLARLRDDVEAAGLGLEVIESLPVHEDVKLGRPSWDRLVDVHAQSLERIGAAGVPIVCYNFMPVFDWTRTDLALRLPDGSTGWRTTTPRWRPSTSCTAHSAFPLLMSSSCPSIVERLLATGAVAGVHLDDPAPMPDVICALVRGVASPLDGLDF